MGRLAHVALATALSCTLAALAACAPPPQPPPPTTCATDDIGIAAGAPLMYLPDSELDRELDTIRAVGARWLRVDIDWSVIEPNRGQQNWSVPDRVVDRARARGLEVVGIVAYTPAWARVAGGGDTHGYPADPAAFAGFARQAAQRYSTRVTHWEIWNEPNLTNFFRPRPDVGKYVELLAAAAPAVKSVQPNARILNGGLAPAVDNGSDISPVTYVQQLYARGAHQYFDILSVHPYSYPALPSDVSTQSWNTFYRMRLMRDTMVQYGDAATPVWATEFGAPTGTASNAVSTQRQADIIADGIAEARRLGWVQKVFVYSMRDRGTNKADVEQNFGLLYQNFSAKPSRAVVASATSGCAAANDTLESTNTPADAVW
ncbi:MULTISPECIES: GH39 family glycosyl hydrolase [Rhodococcus]|nr:MULTISPECIES: cellulase family glycosylhydrolase [Rhodococcus]KHJ72936.1 beta-xylosidase [Rhodococcus sp. Chr-9]SEC23347.1 Glycosyl hydrolase catalytic core [Rhodococcus pyridinivorans]